VLLTLRCFWFNNQRRSESFVLIYDIINRYRYILNTNEPVDKLEIEYDLASVRQPVWDYVVQNCPSFENRNCDASLVRFLILFMKRKKNLFRTTFTLTENCNSCNKKLDFSGNTILNVISEADIRSLSDLNDWQILTIACTCGSLSDSLSIQSFTLPKIYVIDLQNRYVSDGISF